MFGKKILVCYLCLAAVACRGHNASSAIAKQFADTRQVNLASAVPGNWEKVCVLGPYANNQAAQKTLGFAWNVESKSEIYSSDSITLLLFVHEKQVVSQIEQPRSKGDFSNLSEQCFAKEKAQFVQVDKPSKGWPGLFLKSSEKTIPPK